MPLAKRAFTVDEYHRMAEVGILGEDDRVELLDGQIVEMTPIGPAHSGCVGALSTILPRLVAEAAVIWVQNPIQLGRDDAEPQPDLALLRPPPDRYRRRHPQPDDVLLIIEVADTSLEYDRDVKAPHYARAGIPEMWLVDLQGERIQIHRNPGPDGYTIVRTAARGETISPLAFPQVRISSDDILG